MCLLVQWISPDNNETRKQERHRHRAGKNRQFGQRVQRNVARVCALRKADDVEADPGKKTAKPEAGFLCERARRKIEAFLTTSGIQLMLVNGIGEHRVDDDVQRNEKDLRHAVHQINETESTANIEDVEQAEEKSDRRCEAEYRAQSHADHE